MSGYGITDGKISTIRMRNAELADLLGSTPEDCHCASTPTAPTLRDQFAAAALAGLIAKGTLDHESMAKAAFKIADAMMDAKSQEIAAVPPTEDRAKPTEKPYSAELWIEDGIFTGLQLTSNNPEAAKELDLLLDGSISGMPYCNRVILRPSSWQSGNGKTEVVFLRSR